MRHAQKTPPYLLDRYPVLEGLQFLIGTSIVYSVVHGLNIKDVAFEWVVRVATDVKIRIPASLELNVTTNPRRTFNESIEYSHFCFVTNYEKLEQVLSYFDGLPFGDVSVRWNPNRDQISKHWAGVIVPKNYGVDEGLENFDLIHTMSGVFVVRHKDELLHANILGLETYVF